MIKEKIHTEKIFAFIGKYRYVTVVMVLGLVLLILSPGEKKDKVLDIHNNNFDLEAFEKEIETVLLKCEGVGRAEVVLSINSGPENIYAKESKQTMRAQESGVVKESDSDIRPSIRSEGAGVESPIVIKEMYPEFRGAVIVCDGADVVAVRNKVIESVAALTGLGTDRISVIKMKK